MSINVTFGSGLMKVSINKRSNDGKTEEIISAALTGLKAQLLVNAMNQMEADMEAGSAEGKAWKWLPATLLCCRRSNNCNSAGNRLCRFSIY